MFTHRKKPLFPVKVGEVDPKFAQKPLEQFGGRSGEFTAMTEYFVQYFACSNQGIREMHLDIATEELCHLEMVGLMGEQLLRSAERVAAYEGTLFSMMGQGPQFDDSMGNAWTSEARGTPTASGFSSIDPRINFRPRSKDRNREIHFASNRSTPRDDRTTNSRGGEHVVRPTVGASPGRSSDRRRPSSHR